jgi:hypothetical protein
MRENIMRRGERFGLAGFVVISGLIGIAGSPAWATKYAGDPYHIGVGGRALGRGGAATASIPDAAMVFWNIASLTSLQEPEIVLQHAETFGSLLNHDFAAVAVPAREADGWAWGAYGTYLGGGGILLTEYDSTTGRPVLDEETHHGDWSVAFGVARSLKPWLSFGVVAKTVVRDIPDNTAWGLGLDLAAWAQWRRTRFGLKVADATTTFLSYDSGRQETILPHVNWGGEADLPPVAEGLKLIVSAEGETYFENRKTAAQYWSGSISLDLHLGLELAYRDRLFARAGSDAGVLALGAGFILGRWGIDAAVTDHEFLENTYRFSLRFALR